VSGRVANILFGETDVLELIAIVLAALWLLGAVIAIALCRAASASRSVVDLFEAERRRRAAKARRSRALAG
jgi:hypothetical protein